MLLVTTCKRSRLSRMRNIFRITKFRSQVTFFSFSVTKSCSSPQSQSSGWHFPQAWIQYWSPSRRIANLVLLRVLASTLVHKPTKGCSACGEGDGDVLVAVRVGEATDPFGGGVGVVSNMAKPLASSNPPRKKNCQPDRQLLAIKTTTLLQPATC